MFFNWAFHRPDSRAWAHCDDHHRVRATGGIHSQAMALEPTVEPTASDPIVFHWGEVIVESLRRADTYKPSRGLGSQACPHPVVALCRLLAVFDARDGITYRWERPCLDTPTT